jgi:tripartite-type tricarboxylate transporter receptor subunit TctC
MRVLAAFQPNRHPVFPDVPTAKEAGYDVANGVWFLLMAPKGTPAPVLRYLQEAAREAIQDPKFAQTLAERGMDADYRPGDALRAGLWREYKAHTEILRRIGMIKK